MSLGTQIKTYLQKQIKTGRYKSSHLLEWCIYGPKTLMYNTATTCIMIFDWLNYEKKFSSEINGEFDM